MRDVGSHLQSLRQQKSLLQPQGFLADDMNTSEAEDRDAQNLQQALKERRQKIALHKGIPPEPEPAN